MKRKTSALPTKIYAYGCGPPVSGAALVDEQLRAARAYRNTLIEIELERRRAYRAIVGEDAAIQAEEARVAEWVMERDVLRATIKAVRSAARTRVDATADVQRRIRELNQTIRDARGQLKETRGRRRMDPRVAYFVGWIDGCAQAAVRAARAATSAFWGTYLLVERAHEQIRASKTDPQFRRWDGSGMVGVQLQGGWTMNDAETDTRLRLVPVASGNPKHWLVSLRVGSAGRDPIWASWPVTLHRPLPEGATVKWAWVQRRRLGAHWRWQLCLTVEAEFPQPKRGTGVVALDVGWRLREDRALRVAYWCDERGGKGEILLPGGKGGILDRMQHADSLREIQDRAFNAQRDQFVAWMRDHTYPDWLRDATAHLEQWRSAERLAGVVVRWRGERFDGDGDMFAAAEAWRKQHKHLHEWEANERDKALARRQDVYRNAAADLARRYETVVLERFDLRQVARTAAPESDPDLPAPIRYQQRVAAVSELRRCLREKMTVAEVDAPGTTTTCSDCGCTMPSPGESLMVACPGCARIWDQDENAARVILARHASGPVSSASGEPLAAEAANDSAGVLGDGGAEMAERDAE